MQARELQYLQETKESVFFAVGSYGNDPKRAGMCYRMKLRGVKSDIIMQVTLFPTHHLRMISQHNFHSYHRLSAQAITRIHTL